MVRCEPARPPAPQKKQFATMPAIALSVHALG